MSLTELGSRIAAPTSSEDRAAAVFEAATRPGTFSSMYTMFRTKKIPEATFLENIVVRDMGVPRQHAPDCASVFIENMKFAGVVRTVATGEWLGTEPIAGTPSGEDTDTDEAPVLDKEESRHLPGTPPPTIEKFDATLYLSDMGTTRNLSNSLRRFSMNTRFPTRSQWKKRTGDARSPPKSPKS